MSRNNEEMLGHYQNEYRALREENQSLRHSHSHNEQAKSQLLEEEIRRLEQIIDIRNEQF